MARTREDLQTLLEEILGSRNVYFQPPESVKMGYPAIVYARAIIGNTYADNRVYSQKRHYTVTVIDPDPDSELVWKVSLLPGCRFDRHYKADNLNHDVFTVYW